MSLNLVCFSPCVPYPGIAHAGGGALQSYLDLTSHLGRRIIVAPAWAQNIGRETKNLDDLRLIQPSRSIYGGLLNQIPRHLPRYQLAPSIRDRILRDEVTVASLAKADVVEYHWQETATALLQPSRTLAPRARHVVFLHDVASQSLRRIAATKTGLRGLQARLATRVAEADEARIVSQADAVIVVSAKDRDLLPASTKVVVQRSVVRVKPRTRDRQTGVRPVFLFVAAFSRLENVEAAAWLASEVWPRVRAAIDGAELRLVGAQSETRLAGIVDPSSGVRATGYVADLDREYESADIALIPILRGAGVKLKTLEAMITATPTVSTSVGAEGIDRAADFIEIADSAEAFAAAAIRIASDTTNAYVTRANAGALWAMNAHGEEQCRAALTLAITGSANSEV